MSSWVASYRMKCLRHGTSPIAFIRVGTAPVRYSTGLLNFDLDDIRVPSLHLHFVRKVTRVPGHASGIEFSVTPL